MEKNERFLGFKNNNSQNPDGGYWELKSVEVSKKNNQIKFKETIAVTMVKEKDLNIISFEKSHIYQKIKKILIVSYFRENGKCYISILRFFL